MNVSKREQIIAKIKRLEEDRKQPITPRELRRASCTRMYGRQQVPEESITVILRAANSLEAEQQRLAELVKGLRGILDGSMVVTGGEWWDAINALLLAHGFAPEAEMAREAALEAAGGVVSGEGAGGPADD